MKPILQSATVPAGQMAPSVDEINERRILSLICNYPVRALELAQRAGITPEYFTIPAYGEAFAELLKAAPSSNYAASDIVRKYLCGLSNGEVEKFINLAVLHECEFRMSEFAAAAVSLDVEFVGGSRIQTGNGKWVGRSANRSTSARGETGRTIFDVPSVSGTVFYPRQRNLR